MRSFLLNAHLAMAATMVGGALAAGPAFADVADDTASGEDDGTDDGGDDDDDDKDGCGDDDATTGASLMLGLGMLAGLKRRWN